MNRDFSQRDATPNAPLSMGAFVVAGAAWYLVAFLNLYFFSYASMDSWCYAAPAAFAKGPLQLTTPLLGGFEGAYDGWGLHWPGGPLMASLLTSWLPHHPATSVVIHLTFWALLAAAVAWLTRRLTGSLPAAFVAFLFIIGNRLCFGVTWLQRYEMLGGALACVTALALADPARWPRLRPWLIPSAFFLFPMLHPVFTGLGFGWVAMLAAITWLLRRRWSTVALAAGGYAAGWAALVAYFALQPAQYARFTDHAGVGMQITRDTAPLGVSTFVRGLLIFDTPLMIGALVFLCALGAAGWLCWQMWKARSELRGFIARHELSIYLAAALIGTLALAQSTYNGYYWTTAWPFAVIVACQGAVTVLRPWIARCPRTIFALAILLAAVHAAALPLRTLKWAKVGFVNYRAEAERFVRALPAGRLFIPDSLWDLVAVREREARMNTMPYNCGPAMRQRYDADLQATLRTGDIVIADSLQSHPIDWPRPPEWKEIARLKLVWRGSGTMRGLDLTAYEKQ